MKNVIGVALILALFSWSCTKSEAKQTNSGIVTTQEDSSSWGISIDQANRMISSYLNGIDYRVNTNKTRAFFCNADELRNYLSNPKITRFKIVLAHNMTYILSGGEGKRPGDNDNALTLVIVGVDSNNNYVTFKQDKVLDQLAPCPDQCAISGSASNNLIVTQ